MITLSIDENNKEVLRISASYLLALAGDITANITLTDGDALADLNSTRRPDNSTFNEAELSEADHLAQEGAIANDGKYAPTLTHPNAQPDPVTVFASPPAPAVAPSIAAVEAFATAPGDTTATTLTQSANVPLPPAQTAPVTDAPTGTVAQSSSPAPGVEVDARGLPWDSRIHSRTKSKLANGNWKNARGIDADTITDIEAELTRVMAIPAPLVHAAAVSAPPVTVAPAVPAPPITVNGASPSDDGPSFPKLMLKVSTEISANRLTQAQVLAIVQAIGIPSLPGLIQRPDLIPQVEVAIDAQIVANQS